MSIKNKHYKFLKNYIVQECKYYECVYSPDDRCFPRKELYGYINAYYDLENINDDEKQKLIYIVAKLYQYYQNCVTLFLGDELLKEAEGNGYKVEAKTRLYNPGRD